MAGRFTRLEMSGDERQESRTEQAERVGGVPVRTAQHDLQEAHGAYMSGRFEPALQMYTRALQADRALIPAWVGQVQMLIELREYDEARLWSDKALELFKSNGDLLAAKARACLRAGDRPAAVSCSDESLRSQGSSSMRWQSRGEIMLGRRGERARSCFDKALTESAADWFDRVIIARIYLFHHKPTPALEFAQAAVKLEPGHHYAWYVLGRCQEALGWLGEAGVSYRRSLELPGDRSRARSALGALESRGITARLSAWLGGLFRR
jgi:tetratricopeptide (TPR) repeat protein